MTKILMTLCVCFLLTSCAEDNTRTERELKSLEQKIDTTLERAADSIEVKAEKLGDKIRSKVREAKDSLRTRDSIRY